MGIRTPCSLRWGFTWPCPGNPALGTEQTMPERTTKKLLTPDKVCEPCAWYPVGGSHSHKNTLTSLAGRRPTRVSEAARVSGDQGVGQQMTQSFREASGWRRVCWEAGRRRT